MESGVWLRCGKELQFVECFLEDFFEVGCKIRVAGEIKSFSVQQFFKNAAEVWASSPHLRSKLDFANWFFCCNCIFWNCQIQIKLNDKNQGCKFEQGNRAIAARWQAKAGVEPPFAGRWKLFFLGARIFCKVIFRCNCSPGTVARDLFTAKISQGGAVLSMSLT